MTATLLPNAKAQFIDNTGKPLVGGKVYFYIPNTSTLKNTYQDAAQTILNTNPVVLDANGQALIWGSGTYRQVVYDQNGNLIWDQITQDTSGGLLGSMTDNQFFSGTGFTPGTTTQLTLTAGPGGVPNTWVFFDGAFQDDSTYSVNGTTLTFNSPIPLGVSVVTVKVGSTVSIGTPSAGTVIDNSIASGTKISNRLSMWFDVKDPAFGAKGNGVTDDTSAIQACINAAMAVGGTVFFSPGSYLCGSLTVNTGAGGAIFAIPRTAQLIPNANSVTFFTLNNSINQKPFVIDGLTFNNSTLKTGCNAVSGQNQYQLALRNIVVIQMAYVVQLTASAPTTQAFNASIENVVQYGSGSFSFAGVGSGAGAARYFDVHISNVTQFTTGGDTWVAPWFTFTRVITALMSNVHGQSLSGNAIGVHIVGQCEGVFLNNCVIPFPATGILMDLSNGDTILPSWIYLSNVGIDQPMISAIDANCNYLRIANCNLTNGTRQNTGPGFLIRGTCVDYTIVGTQVQGMWGDGLSIISGASQGQFIGCNFNGNGLSGTGSDMNIVATTPMDPFFTNCHVGTKNLNGSALLNGGSTSRYINSQRLQVASNGTTNQVVATYTVPANTFVDGKTISISTSGAFGATGNAKTIIVQVGGINVGAISSSQNGGSWKINASCFRVDASNVWLVAETFAGSTCNVTSTLQTPFNSSAPIQIQLLVSTTAASDVLMHHFDVELVN